MDNRITTIAWAAGFVDADGTISLKRKRNVGGYIHYQPFIAVTQIAEYRNSLEKLQKLFGGSIYASKQENRLPIVRWAIVARQAIACAKEMHPYLVVKKHRAELIISFEKLLTKRGEQYRLSEKNHLERATLFNLIRAENRKGSLRLQRLSEKTPQGEATV